MDGYRWIDKDLLDIDSVIWDSTWTWACTGFVSLSLCALQWCMLLACTLQVYTHTHTDFPFSFGLSLPFVHTNTFRHVLLECVNFMFQAQRSSCIAVDSSFLSLSSLNSHTLWSVSLDFPLYDCVCVFERKILYMWGPFVFPQRPF